MLGTGLGEMLCEFELGLSLAVELHTELGVAGEKRAEPRGSFVTVLPGLLKLTLHHLLNDTERCRVSAVLLSLEPFLLRRTTPRHE